ncbi:hypothetical protein BJ165DRAFT_1524316 [Panaeolus papilionaceus]|nr:hypothetical protein BJ165DRAFT_1524316 [Panaeolus papilionaceus]
MKTEPNIATCNEPPPPNVHRHRPTDSFIVEKELVDTCHGLQDVEAERRQLDSRIAALQLELERIQKRRNDLAPCFKLPTELFSRIFIYVQQVCSDDFGCTGKRIRPKYDWIKLASVCRLWRSVVLDTAQLWTDIDLSMKTEWTQISMERSRQATLIVSIPPIKSNKEQLLATLDQLHRFRCLRLYLPKPLLDRTQLMRDLTIILNKFSTTVAPLLETLVLSNLPIETYSFSIMMFVGAPPFSPAGLPNLRNLEVDGWKLPWSSLLFTGLTTLKVSSPLTGTLEEFFHALGRLLQLKELSLSGGALPEGPEDFLQDLVVEFRFLEHIYFSGTVKDATVIFRHIAVPLKTQIDIHISFEEENPTPNSFKSAFRNFSLSLSTAWLCGRIAAQAKCGIRALMAEEVDDGLSIRGWVQKNVDFAKRSPTAHPDLLEDSSIPQSSLSITIEPCIASAPQLLQTFFSTFPLRKLGAVYLDISPTERGWAFLAQLPSLESLSFTTNTALKFFDYADNDPAMGVFYDDEETDSKLELDSTSATRFCNLTHLSFDRVDLGSREYVLPNDLDAIDWHTFYEFLMYRCELGAPLQHMRFSRCINLWEVDVMKVREVVSDVMWDGREESRDDDDLREESDDDSGSEGTESDES